MARKHLTLGVTSTNTLPATTSLALKYADYCELIVEYSDLLGGPADDLYIRKRTFTAPDRHYRERRRPYDNGLSSVNNRAASDPERLRGIQAHNAHARFSTSIEGEQRHDAEIKGPQEERERGADTIPTGCLHVGGFHGYHPRVRRWGLALR
ncbi:hypothetical protein LTR42_010445 [Elasticomyces elasticus]|nr:hypothetical protein LTR42_010445 [Elasticomyces elasticus]